MEVILLAATKKARGEVRNNCNGPWVSPRFGFYGVRGQMLSAKRRRLGGKKISGAGKKHSRKRMFSIAQPGGWKLFEKEAQGRT